MKENDLAANNNAIDSEITEELPTEMRHMMRLMSVTMRSGPAESPIAKHITSEHITKNQELDEKAMAYEDKDRTRKFWLTIIFAIVSVVVLGLVLFLFRDDSEILIPIITLLVGGGGGFSGGYGYGYIKSKRNN